MKGNKKPDNTSEWDYRSDQRNNCKEVKKRIVLQQTQQCECHLCVQLTNTSKQDIFLKQDTLLLWFMTEHNNTKEALLKMDRKINSIALNTGAWCSKLTSVLSGSRFGLSLGLAPVSLPARAVCLMFQCLHHTSPSVTQPIRSTSCLRQPRRPLALQGKGIWELLPSHILRCFFANETHSDAWRSRRAEALFSKQMNSYATAGRCFLYKSVMENKEQRPACVCVALFANPYRDGRGVQRNVRVHSSFPQNMKNNGCINNIQVYIMYYVECTVLCISIHPYWTFPSCIVIQPYRVWIYTLYLIICLCKNLYFTDFWPSMDLRSWWILMHPTYVSLSFVTTYIFANNKELQVVMNLWTC